MDNTSSHFRLIDIRTLKKMSSLFAGNYKTSFHGSGMEFSEIREYAFGDNISDIDWNTTAKTGKAYVKRYEEEREVKTLFLLDVGVDMRFGRPDRTKLSTEKEIFSILSFSSIGSNDPIGACFFSDTVLECTPMDKGMPQLLKLHKKLDSLSHNASGHSSLSSIIESLYFKKITNHLVFILTDSLDVGNESLFRALCIKNDCVLVHIHDSFENSLGTSGVFHFISGSREYYVNTAHEKERQNYINLRSLEISEFKKKVLSLGASYLFLDDSKNVYKELYGFFKRRQK